MPEAGLPIRLSDVAARAGVSLATVSRSLTNTSGVSPALAERVRGIAADMGYVTNMNARSLAGGLASSIGLVLTNIADPYFAEIASSLIAVAADDSRSVQIAHAVTPEDVLAQIKIFRSYRVGAIVLAGSGYSDPATEIATGKELAAYEQSGGRIAVVGRHALDASAVLPDNIGAGRAIAEHLVALGHSKIAVLSGPEQLNAIGDRMRGLTEVLGSRVVHISQHAFSREGGAEGVRELFGNTLVAGPRRQDITAIVALSDVMAVGAFSELRALGVTIPTDVSLTGFDDISVADVISDGLTTARLSTQHIGEAIFELICGENSQRRDIEIGFTLIERGSTAQP